MPPGLAASDEAVRSLAAEILAGEPYAAFREDRQDVWLGLLGWLADALSWLDRLRLGEPLLYWLVIAALLLISLGLLAHVVWTVSLALRMPGAPPPRGGTAGPDLLARADAHARAGRLLEAARLVQLATLEALLQRRVIDLARSEPNRVLRARLQLAALPDAERGELVALLDRLERGLFRGGVADPDLYRDWQRLHGRVAALAAATA